MLRDRTYIGQLLFRGQWHPGAFDALIERPTFDRVQILIGEKVYRMFELTYSGNAVCSTHSSCNDGKSWSHVCHLPGVGGYLSATQAPNRVIHVFGTRMSCVAFNEAWLKQGKPISQSRRKTKP